MFPSTSLKVSLSPYSYNTYIRVLQNATEVEIDLVQYILVLDHVHRSQIVLIEVSRMVIQMTTFALKF